jgi:formylglycine-generating enzyme required for sulfatase activity/class 3 adenylate cyclase
MSSLPAGLVTFIFTDIAGYTRGFEAAPEAMARAVSRHDSCVRAAVDHAGGHVFKTIGDAFQIAFATPERAVAAAMAAQRALAAEDWSAFAGLPDPLRVRMAIDVVPAQPLDGDYRTPRLNRIARLMAAGHGGQLLLTATAVAALGDRVPAGVALRDLGAHRLKDLREPVAAYQVVAAGMPDIATPLKTAGPLTTRDRIVVVDPRAGDGARTPAGTGRPVATLLAELLAVVRGAAEAITLTLGDVRALAQHRPADLTEYRLIRLAEWSQPRYQLDNRFVALTLLVDQGEQAARDRWVAAPERYDDLRELLGAVPDPAVVLLGPPGSGKSTLLRRLELDLAIASLRAEAEVVSWFVPLGQYRPDSVGGDPPDPADWLARRWAERYPALPALSDLLADGHLVLLLDGLNEMPHATTAQHRAAMRQWQRYVAALAAAAPGNRVVFSCRSLDYSAPLSTPDLRVPQVLVEPMSDGQIREFLDAYAPALAPELWDRLMSWGQVALVRSPYLARLLVEQALHEGTRATSQAALITGFVRQALRREIELDNPLLEPDTLLSERDLRGLTLGGWSSPYDLPERGVLVPRTAALAHAMQAGRDVADGGQVRLGYAAAVGAVGEPRGADVLRAGVDLGWLDEDPAADEVMFFHQLLQEYFAARALAAHPEPARLTVPWRAADIVPDMPTVVAQLPLADPLPPLPTSGWEETAVMAAAMAPDPGDFVAGLMDSNLALAGRAASQADVLAHLPGPTVDRLRQALVDRSRDPAADLRARLGAGLALGTLGDPRFERRRGPFGEYLLPPLVTVPGGAYVLGHDDAIEYLEQVWTDHQPRHAVTLPPWQVGRFPVTNAEWACFLAAGGHDDERWWDTPAGRAWRAGEGTSAGTHANIRNMLGVLRANPELCDQEHAAGRWSDEIHERWLARLAMTAAELDAHLHELYPGRRETEPRFWRDGRYGNPAQPVVGISWYEARAYCAWLGAQTGRPFRLLTEAEWEATARGPGGRAYAYGEAFDPWAANVQETHLRQVTPVGIFPAGDTPEGVADMTGNVYTWTSTAWGQDPERTAFPYPYRADDDRELADAPLDMRRLIRGGSWYDYEPLSRAYARLDTYPGDRLRISGLGLRLAV